MLVVIVVVLGVLVDPDVSPIGFARSISATTASICRLFRFCGPAKVTATIVCTTAVYVVDAETRRRGFTRDNLVRTAALLPPSSCLRVTVHPNPSPASKQCFIFLVAEHEGLSWASVTIAKLELDDSAFVCHCFKKTELLFTRSIRRSRRPSTAISY
jgi:hypothetical protein